ncbi:MAG: AAA family ATPase [Candidatus Hydrogenedentes bacterium]|nr:AAA family ATPase [Candidatus Hydrogenedentota bacterium]
MDKDSQVYNEFFNFMRDPFSLEPNLDFFYMSESVKNFLEELYQQIRSNASFCIVFGGAGVGKSTLYNKIIADLNSFENSPYVLPVKCIGFDLDARDFLMAMLKGEGLDYEEAKTLHAMVESWLVKLIEMSNVSRVLIVDDAQCLTSENSLELLKTLASLRIGGEKLINVVLLGDLKWRELIKESEGFFDLITIHFQLEPLSEREVQYFIELRLEKCGYNEVEGPKFSGSAYTAIYACTQGIPKKIIELLRSVFTELASRNEKYVDANIVLECFEKKFHPTPKDRVRIARALLEYEMRPENVAETKKMSTKELEQWQRNIKSVEILLKEYDKME